MGWETAVSMADREVFDIFVIGGGVNGCGIARDAAGRGYSVFLAEMNDLASGTSSDSTKLVHGGLRYLEHYEFRLVREALIEREILWSIAPHIIWPLRFVLPHHRGLRPAWLLRLGLFLYDHLGGRRLLPATRTLDLRTDRAGEPLKPVFDKGFEYSDGWVNDARLVVLNARDAADRGAVIRTRTTVVSVTRGADLWDIVVEDNESGVRQTVQARLLVNAAGPWVDHVIADVVRRKEARHVRLVQGSHIVIRRKYDDPRAYIFQNGDGRIVFAIPYERDFTLIGTTDRDFKGDPARAEISGEEIDYLCSAASEYFSAPVTRNDIVWTYSGVRPLFDDGASAAQEATRDYVLREEEGSGAPMINIFGGKITTYRRLAESMVAMIEHRLGRRGKSWTGTAPLPGGDFPMTGFDALLSKLHEDYPFLSRPFGWRLCRLYGTRARAILGAAHTIGDLGECFGGDLTAAEVDYLMDHEWAVSAEDVLWRRTKLGLTTEPSAVGPLERYMRARQRGETVAAQ